MDRCAMAGQSRRMVLTNAQTKPPKYAA